MKLNALRPTPRRLARRRGGQVIIIALLAILLLAGMVFYVFNVGEQVNRRVSMQADADSAAISGSTWMARSMNIVAMNNVAQTRLITAAAVLDSLPLATEMSYEEVTEWLRGLDQQLGKGIPDQYLTEGLTSMADRFRAQQAKLAPLYSTLITQGYDVRPTTHWRTGAGGDVPHGTLWVGAKALEDFNRATVSTCGYLAQVNASQMGTASGAQTAFIVPVLPDMPAEMGTFLDFKKPIMEGRPSEYVQGTIGDHIRRGPYDQLFHWRHARYDESRREQIGTRSVQGNSGPMKGSRGYGLSGKSTGTEVVGGTRDHNVAIYRTVHGPQVGWNAWGVYSWMLEGRSPSSGLADFAQGDQWYTASNGQRHRVGGLQDTNWLNYMQTLAKTKLNYMWGAASKTIHKPHWISPFEEAKAIAEAGEIDDPNAPPPDPNNPNAPPVPKIAVNVKFTMFYMVQTKSKYPPTGGSYRATPGTYVTNSDYPKAYWVKGWVNPEDWQTDPTRNAVKIADHVWQIDWQYETTFDETIGLSRADGYVTNPDGTQTPVWHPVYIREQYVFGGIDIGTDVTIRNPANWQAGEAPPRPYLLDLTRADYRTDGEKWYMSYLGVARTDTQANVWPHRFHSGNPYENVLALSEAHVFNNMSWDLWTPEWQARLRPIGDWDYWVNDRMDAPPQDVDAVRNFISPNELQQIQAVLQAYDPGMVQRLLTH